METKYHSKQKAGVFSCCDVLPLSLLIRSGSSRLSVDFSYGDKQWSKACYKANVQKWPAKQHTKVRIQFCDGYYDKEMHFVVAVPSQPGNPIQAVTTKKIIVRGQKQRGKRVRKSRKTALRSGQESLKDNKSRPSAGTNDTKSSDAKSSDVQSSDVKSSVVKSSDVKSSDVKSSDVKASDVKSSDVKNSDVKASDVKSSDVKSSDVKSSDVKSSDVKASDAKAKDVKSSDMKSSDVKAKDVKAKDVKGNVLQPPAKRPALDKASTIEESSRQTDSRIVARATSEATRDHEATEAKEREADNTTAVSKTSVTSEVAEVNQATEATKGLSRKRKLPSLQSTQPSK